MTPTHQLANVEPDPYEDVVVWVMLVFVVFTARSERRRRRLRAEA
ncbi:MAG: hypothetical protein JWP87_5480 [Labilithrix sp.]|nr:hypothetical protein [Labilithrix sp.]